MIPLYHRVWSKSSKIKGFKHFIASVDAGFFSFIIAFAGSKIASIVQSSFGIDPFSRMLFLFCGKCAGRMKALLWEDGGFMLLYKRFENGKFLWPSTEVSHRRNSDGSQKGYPLNRIVF